MAGSLLGISFPGFWVGMMLIFFFSVRYQFLPSSGRGETIQFLGLRLSILTRDGWAHIILPAVTLALATLAIILRITRAGMMEVMRQDYIRFARAKGASRRHILFAHGLKNALIPVVTIFGLQLGDLIAFATITETIFAWPGTGKLLIDSDLSRRPSCDRRLSDADCLHLRRYQFHCRHRLHADRPSHHREMRAT